MTIIASPFAGCEWCGAVGEAAVTTDDPPACVCVVCVRLLRGISDDED